MTMYWYKKLHEAWREHPPADWLMAAQLKYKAPATFKGRTWREALDNTVGMAKFLLGRPRPESKP